MLPLGMQASVSPATYQGQVDLKYPWEGSWEVNTALLGHGYPRIYFHNQIGRLGNPVKSQSPFLALRSFPSPQTLSVGTGSATQSIQNPQNYLRTHLLSTWCFWFYNGKASIKLHNKLKREGEQSFPNFRCKWLDTFTSERLGNGNIGRFDFLAYDNS